MASISNTAVVSEARGKLGSEIFSRNRGGAYVKTYAIPTNPASAYQTTARSRFAQASSAYAALTDADIILWENLAKKIRVSNRVAQKINLSARALFIQRFMNRYSVAPFGNPEPIQVEGIVNLKITWFVIYPFYFRFQLNYTGPVLNQGLVCFSNVDQPQTVRSINTVPLYEFFNQPFLNNSIISVRPEYTARFGVNPIPQDRAIFIRTRVIDWDSGQVLAVFQNRQIVQ